MTKKFTPIFFSVLFLLVSTKSEAGFSVTGTIESLAPGTKLELSRENIDARSQRSVGQIIVDSDHSFSAEFDTEAGIFFLKGTGKDAIRLAIDEDQTLDIRGNNFTSAKITGSPDTDLLLAYESFRKESLARLVYPPRAKAHSAKARGASTEEVSRLSQLETEGYDAHRRELNDFTIDTVKQSVALYATSLRWDGDYRFEELQRTVDLFAETNSDLEITKSMQERLRFFQKTALGTIASPLEGERYDGEKFALSDLKGKYVLLDFWASWCTPCRIENLHYKKLHDEYKSQGFEIFAVSVDTSKSSWQKASKRDGVTWPEISDLQAWNSPLAKAYNISALPANFLLDPEGRIIAKNLRGSYLDEKLVELLGTP